MKRAALLAALLACTAPAIAQDIPEPRSDFVALRKEAKADIAIRKALGDQTRSMDARLRDKGRMVELILRAAAVTPGDSVLDVGAGSGYLTVLFAAMAGPKGHVDLHNTPGWIAQFPSMEPQRQRTWITKPNIGWLTQSWNDLDAPPNRYDVIMLGQVYHDVFLEAGDHRAMLKRFFAMLKPGGRIVVEDHDAIPEMTLHDQVVLHRISHGDVTGHFLCAGFALKEMLLMDSTFDDEKFNVFRPDVRGRTDRYIAVFTKPHR